jgi:hypothetical protein
LRYSTTSCTALARPAGDSIASTAKKRGGEREEAMTQTIDTSTPDVVRFLDVFDD